jgi:hypothetical protein
MQYAVSAAGYQLAWSTIVIDVPTSHYSGRAPKIRESDLLDPMAEQLDIADLAHNTV